MKRMAAGSFKVRCLAVMDEAQAKRETVVITKYGKPVAKLVPVLASFGHTQDAVIPAKAGIQFSAPCFQGFSSGFPLSRE